MKLHYPDFVEIEISPSDKDSSKFKYRYLERFLIKSGVACVKDKESMARTMKTTLDIARAALSSDWQLTNGEDWLQIYNPCVSRELIGETQISEFTGWLYSALTLEELSKLLNEPSLTHGLEEVLEKFNEKFK